MKLKNVVLSSVVGMCLTSATVSGRSVEQADEALAAAGIDPEARPETLTPGDFARLVRAVDER